MSEQQGGNSDWGGMAMAMLPQIAAALFPRGSTGSRIAQGISGALAGYGQMQAQQAQQQAAMAKAAREDKRWNMNYDLNLRTANRADATAGEVSADRVTDNELARKKFELDVWKANALVERERRATGKVRASTQRKLDAARAKAAALGGEAAPTPGASGLPSGLTSRAPVQTAPYVAGQGGGTTSPAPAGAGGLNGSQNIDVPEDGGAGYPAPTQESVSPTQESVPPTPPPAQAPETAAEWDMRYNNEILKAKAASVSGAAPYTLSDKEAGQIALRNMKTPRPEPPAVGATEGERAKLSLNKLHSRVMLPKKGASPTAEDEQNFADLYHEEEANRLKAAGKNAQGEYQYMEKPPSPKLRSMYKKLYGESMPSGGSRDGGNWPSRDNWRALRENFHAQFSPTAPAPQPPASAPQVVEDMTGLGKYPQPPTGGPSGITVDGQPVAQTPVAEQPVAQTPVAPAPVAEQPVAQTPASEPVTSTGATDWAATNQQAAAGQPVRYNQAAARAATSYNSNTATPTVITLSQGKAANLMGDQQATVVFSILDKLSEELDKSTTAGELNVGFIGSLKTTLPVSTFISVWPQLASELGIDNSSALSIDNYVNMLKGMMREPITQEKGRFSDGDQKLVNSLVDLMGGNVTPEHAERMLDRLSWLMGKLNPQHPRVRSQVERAVRNQKLTQSRTSGQQ